MTMINGRYQGRGLLQTTGKHMTNSVTINGSSYQGLSKNNHASAIFASQLSTIDLSFNRHPDIRKFEVFETPIDALTLSCTLQRFRKNGNYSNRIFDREITESINNEDIELSRTIRDYYSKKIMMWKLKTTHITKFREELNTFIHSNGLLIKENQVGMICYLPDFYVYDIAMDNLRLEVTSKVRDSHRNPAMQTRTLIPLDRVIKKSSRTYSIQYWLKDSEGYANLITLEKKNPLEHIWNSMFQSNIELQIQGTYFQKNIDDFEYFSITHWELQKG